MTARRATPADWAALASRARAIDNPDARCDPTHPFPDEQHLALLAERLTVYTADAAWCACRADGTIKWLVAAPTDYRPGGPVAELLDAVHAGHGRAVGRVRNPLVRRGLISAGCTVDDDTGWAVYRPPTRTQPPRSRATHLT